MAAAVRLGSLADENRSPMTVAPCPTICRLTKPVTFKYPICCHSNTGNAAAGKVLSLLRSLVPDVGVGGVKSTIIIRLQSILRLASRDADIN